MNTPSHLNLLNVYFLFLSFGTNLGSVVSHFLIKIICYQAVLNFLRQLNQMYFKNKKL